MNVIIQALKIQHMFQQGYNRPIKCTISLLWNNFFISGNWAVSTMARHTQLLLPFFIIQVALFSHLLALFPFI